VNRPRFYDSIIERALAKDPKQRYATAAEFKAAIQRGVGEPFDTTVWERTLIGAADQLRAPPAPGAGSRSGAGSAHRQRQLVAGAHALGPVRAAGGRSVAGAPRGPLAGVLVRRAARECADLPTLYAKLAEQVTNPQARNAFLEHATHVTTIKTQGGTVLGGSGTRATGTSAATAMGSSGNRGGPPLSDALLEAATRVLAQHVGPIAKVMVKKAAGRTTDHGQFYALLAEAAPEGAARNKLLAELQKLG
jgi:hypothetical protein